MTNAAAQASASQASAPGAVPLLLENARLIRQHFAARLADTGLTESQWRVLAFVARSEGLSQTELAALLGLHKVALGEHLERLQVMGLLRKAPDPADRRSRRVFLAPAAAQVTGQLQQRFARVSQSLQEELGQQWHPLELQLQTIAAAVCAESIRRALDRLTLQTSLHLVGVLARVQGRQLDESLAGQGLSHLQWLVLETVRAQPGISQGSLGCRLAIGKAALGQLLDTLEGEGWLRRKPANDDRRVRQISLGPRGKRREGALQAVGSAQDQLLLAPLAAADRTRFSKNLRRLRTSMVGLRDSQS